MSLSILLHLATLSILSTAALGQTNTFTAECLNALTNFTQESVCFGSEEGLNGFFASLNSTSNSMTNSMEVLNNPNIRRALVTFYDNLCTSQDCVSSYANVIDICLRSALTQLNLDASLLVDQVADFSCATNEGGQYCAIAQLEHMTDFTTIVLCSLGLNTNPRATGISCTNTCDAVRRARSSIGCCINNYFEYVESVFDAINTNPRARFPDYSRVFTNCGVANPGTCSTTLNNPMRSPETTQPPRTMQPPRTTQTPASSSGYYAVRSWGLVAAVVVSVKVILSVVF